jgi:transposase
VLLQKRAGAPTTSQRDAVRARIVLLAAKSESSSTIATQLGISVDCVSTWRGRFSRYGLEGLKDRPRCGRRPTFTPVQRCEIIATACKPAPTHNGTSGWTLDILRDEIVSQKIAPSISRSHLATLLKRADLRPHKKQMWLHSPDPNFREKVTEIVDLYLHPRPGSTVVCIDEKTGMQATERKHPDRPAKVGQLPRREFEYIRHGTQSLLAGFIVRTGTVITSCGQTRTGEDLEAFMEKVAAAIPGNVDVVWDNLNIHHGERWERFNARHGNRFRFHYTPLHASWVNQVELWFGVLQRRCLDNASFTSIETLRDAVASFVAYWNREAKHPFRWSFTGYEQSRQRGEDSWAHAM